MCHLAPELSPQILLENQRDCRILLTLPLFLHLGPYGLPSPVAMHEFLHPSLSALSQWIPFFSLFKDIVLTFSASLASPKFPLLLEHSHQYINVLYYITHPKKSTLTPYLYSATPPFISLFPVRSNSTVPLSTSTSLLLSLPHSN